jgi:uncharacterized membrane protein (DUF106 family)
MLDSFFNSIFGWAIDIAPAFGVFVVSVVMTLIVTIVYKYVTNQTKLKEMKEEMKAIRKEMKEAKDDQKRLMELQKKSFQSSMEQMRHSFKPMLITFVPIIIVFGWLRNTFTAEAVLWELPFNIPKIGDNSGFGWLGIYIITSLILSMVFRKIMKVY